MELTGKTAADDPYLSVPQAAKEIGKANATVLSLIVAGVLEGTRVAGRTVVTRASVEEYKIRNARGSRKSRSGAAK